jgi:putative transposase
VNRSSFYYEPVELKQDTITLMNEIRDIWQAYPFYGYRRIHAVLKRQGWQVNRKRIQELMNTMEIQAIYPKPKTTIPSKTHKVYPYLLKDLKIDRPNQVWATDITYIKMNPGFVYLIAIIDLYSRYIISWRLSITLDVSFCCEALEEALLQEKPEIFNSDQGSQFTCEKWTQILSSQGILISMDGKGRCIDNIYCERLWRAIKYEEVYLRSYDSVSQARESIGNYIEFYNHQRPHQSLGYETPAEVYFQNPRISKPDEYVDNLQASYPTYSQAQQQQLEQIIGI